MVQFRVEPKFREFSRPLSRSDLPLDLLTQPIRFGVPVSVELQEENDISEERQRSLHDILRDGFPRIQTRDKRSEILHEARQSLPLGIG